MLLPGSGTGGYLAFLGRISPEKAPDAAIRIAALAGLPLKIAAKIDNADKQYYEDRVAPLRGASHVEFVGEMKASADRRGDHGLAGLGLRRRAALAMRLSVTRICGSSMSSGS